MNKEINNPAFWADRLKQAKMNGHLHYSVYLANDRWWKRILDAHLKIIREYIKPTESVLDAGCGYGRLSEYFNNYLGIDFSPDFIQEAKTLFPNKNFELQDLRKLPYKKGQFDWGVLDSVKHMIIGNLGMEEWEKMQKEIKRVCKKVLILEYGETESYHDTQESISKYEII